MDATSLPLQIAAFTAAILTSLALAAAALLRSPRGVPQWSFTAGMIGFALETAAAFMVATRGESPGERLFWLQTWTVLATVCLLPWGLFVTSICAPIERWPGRLRFAALTGGVLGLGSTAALSVVPPFVMSEVPGPFYAAQLSRAGVQGVIAQMLLTVAVIAGLDACLRTSTRESRWRIKYLILGLGGVFLVRFFFLSHMLLFHVVLRTYVVAAAASLVLGNLTVAASLARAGLRRVDLKISRVLIYRSLVAGVLGAYLLSVGVLGWLFNYLGIGGELVWGSVLIFASTIGLGALLLSENVRWRVKRFIGMHFYRTKYDYREQWVTFTKRLGSRLSLEAMTPELLAAVTDAVGAARGALYLTEAQGGRYHLVGAVEVDGAPLWVGADGPLIAHLRAVGRPFALEILRPEEVPIRSLREGGVAIPLQWQGALTGLMLVGPDRAGAPYTLEDLEFLATVGEQAAGAITTARLSETVAQAREFEVFNRLTSFVIHDLKNSISALSLLSQNALAHFDDPEFQRDAIKTLSRTVDRIQALLGRLSAAPEAAALHFQPVDLSAVALEATRPMGVGGRVSLVKELAPVAPAPGDPDALLRVIQNLITNAVEAIEGEGTVTVQTFEEPRWAVCAVTDTGKGMSQEFLQKSLFAPFRSTKKGGWGIGLYQAKGIVEAHGGTIEVTSREGQGTTFRVKLPREAARGEGSNP